MEIKIKKMFAYCEYNDQYEHFKSMETNLD